MNREIFNTVKKELMYIGILFLISLVIFKIIYFKDGFLVILRFIASLFWLFALPGYFAMLYWKDRLEFEERFVVGIALSAGVIGIFSYYIGLMGLNIKYHTILLPLVIIIAGVIAGITKRN